MASSKVDSSSRGWIYKFLPVLLSCLLGIVVRHLRTPSTTVEVEKPTTSTINAVHDASSPSISTTSSSSSSSSLASTLTSTCSLTDDQFLNDPNLQDLTFDIGYGPQEFRAYVTPDVATYYQQPPGSMGPPQTMLHGGWAAKFVNISPFRVRLFWDPGHGRLGSPTDILEPMESTGSASFDTHAFYLTPVEDESVILARFVVKPPQSVYYYDAITVEGNEEATQQNMAALNEEQKAAYMNHMTSRKFAKHYFEFTGREYLVTYPRNAPMHKLWPASYFGQEHWVTSSETHFVEMPRDEDLGRIAKYGRSRVLKEDEPRLLQEYRSKEEPMLNMTLKVLSCSPRAFEINNFLSQTEVDHILYLTTGLSLHRSSTAGHTTRIDPDRDTTKDTRTSLNTWLSREHDPIIDAIYRRAADLLRIDEALLRPRSPEEYPHLPNTRSLAEAMQLVHYDPGQEYTAHHDFGYGDFRKKNQPARFATLLLYLNEGMVGGETSFPKWVNAETGRGLDVEPVPGKAVLFYSQLPDGNMDNWSLHAALPVEKGEKWLMNLWVWDPEGI